MTLEALLFDLDGTLVGTHENHFRATVDALAGFGQTIDRQRYEDRVNGGNNDDIRRYFFPEDPDGAGRRYVALKEEIFRRSLGILEPIAGLRAVLSTASARGLGLAVVTNAPTENVAAMLPALGLDGAFDEIVIGDELERGKPDPLPYRVALEQLGVRAEAAIGFEDSPSGLRALSGAGVYAVGIASSQPAATLIAAGADIVVDDYLDPKVLALLQSGPPAL
jgi:HAD superfamily hydrolase (TIGR01509 family)